MPGYKQGKRSTAKGGKKKRSVSSSSTQRRQTPRSMRRKT